MSKLGSPGPSPGKRLPRPTVQLPHFHLVHDAIFSPGGMPVGATLGSPEEETTVPDAGERA